MSLSTREQRLALIGEKASRALGIRSDRLAKHDPAIDEALEVLVKEDVARRAMEDHDELGEHKRRARANLELRTPWNKGGKGKALDS